MLRLLLIFAIITCSASNIFSQNFNSEPVTKFWEIADILSKDGSLTDSLWNSYYTLPGNKKYMENNRSEKNAQEHRKYLEIFFKPSMADSLATLLKDEQVQNNDIFMNLKYIKENEKALREFSQIISSPKYLQTAVELTKQYLPQNRFKEVPEDLNLYIQAITYDAAVQNGNMYFGLSIVHDFDKYQMGTVGAHELHHILRMNNEIKHTLTSRDSASFEVISKINNEGSADLIDKTIIITNEKEMLLGSLFKQVLLSEIEPVIAKLDSSFVTNAGQSDEFITKNEFNEIIKYFSGHIPGFYMADVIKRNGLEKELIDGCENPFNIFYLYNEAAKNDKNKPLTYSKAAIDYLKELEQKVYGQAEIENESE